MSEIEINNNITTLFNPKTVAVIGASKSPRKLGYHVMKSLTDGGFEGRIVPINPGSKEIMGIPSSPSIDAFPDPIDLAIVVVPAQLVPKIFEECERNAIKGVVLITAGFKEIDDPSGDQQQMALAKIALKAGIMVLGPNTFGMVNLHKNLNASFTPDFSSAKKGGVSLVSQSGGVSHLLAFMAMRQGVGLSKIVGLGNRLNVDFAEILPYLMGDTETEVMVFYLEGLDDPRRLMAAAKANKGKKPVVAIKTGNSKTGDRASLSHTGSMAGNHKIYEGAFRQAGILHADSIESALDLAQALVICPPPKSNRIAVLTAQAGPAIAACDVCEAMGLEIPPFKAETQTIINKLLPPLAIRTNPVDMGPVWLDPLSINNIIETVMEDSTIDGIILLTTYASANLELLANISDLLIKWNQKKPLITCLASPPGIWDGEVADLEKTGAIFNLPTPERAAKAMAGLCRYGVLVRERD